MKQITINFIPKLQQRYETFGDYFYDNNGNMHIYVSDDEEELPSDNHKFLIALHELIEAWLCKDRGIKQEAIDEFDIDIFPSLNLPDDFEPGDHEGSPYKNEHRFAMLIEHLMAHELGLKGYGVCK